MSALRRLERIEIQDYKALDHLVLDFPAPAPGELDAFVLGSRNGVGKTSVLECCALILLFTSDYSDFGSPSPVELLAERGVIRAGSERAEINSWFDRSTNRLRIGPVFNAPRLRVDSQAILRCEQILGLHPEPLVTPAVLFFHANRRVREGSLSLDALSNADQKFKTTVILALMSQSGLFEEPTGGPEASEALRQLNLLMESYTGGRLAGLKRDRQGALTLRILPPTGPAFDFDGLSAGQKEIISTLFLIWHATRERPALVLIDEPELHLNAEWQRRLIPTLKALAPWNQYLFATHSEEIYAAFPPERRLMLEPEP